MANQQLLTAFTIGKDMSVTIQINNLLGAVVPGTSSTPYASEDFGILEEWDVKPENKTIRKVPLNLGGVPIERVIESGFNGTMSFSRVGSQIDYLAQVLQDAYYGRGGSVLALITHTIYDPRGSSSGNTVFAYPNSTLRVEDLGTYRGEDGVVQRIAFYCPQRFPISDSSAVLPTTNDPKSDFAAMIAALGVS